MSDNPVETPVEAAVEAVAEPVEGSAPETTEDGQAADEGPLSRQAAKWRTRTRELEAELAAMTETVTGLRRERAEALAAEHGLKPDALWASTDLDSLLDEDGTVDPELVKDAAQAAADKLGVTLKPAHGGLHIPMEGRTTTLPNLSGKTAWDNMFQPGYRR